MHQLAKNPYRKMLVITGLVLSLLLLSSVACTMGGLLGDLSAEGTAAEETITDEVEAANEAQTAPEPESGDDTKENSFEDDEDTEPVVPPAMDGACANVLYPMNMDNQWIYQITSAGETSKFGMTVSEVSEDGATVDMLAYETGITTSADLECDSGEILNFPSMMLGFLFGEVDGDIELEHIDGVYAPSYETLEANNWEYKWETEYIASGEISAVSDGETLYASLSDSPVHMEWEMEGEYETVEVEAGTFEDALIVDREAEFEAALTLESDGETLSLAGTVIMKTRLWFVPFQGLVRQEVTRTQLKLGAATFPVESDTVVELVEYYAGE